jgi:2-methoxy-6-polyprenyl-1,4-benzoquinol methylase
MTSGDVAFRVLERIKSVGHRAMQGTLTAAEEDTHIYVCDINPNMLNVGKKRATERGLEHELFNFDTSISSVVSVIQQLIFIF